MWNRISCHREAKECKHRHRHRQRHMDTHEKAWEAGRGARDTSSWSRNEHRQSSSAAGGQCLVTWSATAWHHRIGSGGSGKERRGRAR